MIVFKAEKKRENEIENIELFVNVNSRWGIHKSKTTNYTYYKNNNLGRMLLPERASLKTL